MKPPPSLSNTTPPTATRPRYIFIDYENVCESDLTRIIDRPVRIFLIVGTKQTRLPTSLVLFAQDHPGQLQFIQNPCDGKSALDFILACELAKLVSIHPEGYFHIISKDTGFDALVKHLRSRKHLISRHASLSQISCLCNPAERFEHLRSELKDPSRPRPLKRRTLESKIQSHFDKQLDPTQLEAKVQDLIRNNILSLTDDGKILYTVGGIIGLAASQGAA